MALLQAFGKQPPKGQNQMHVKVEVSESDAELKTATLEGLYQRKCCIMQERKRLREERKRLREEVVNVDQRIASLEENKLLQDKKRKKRQASSSEEKKEDILKNQILKKQKKVTLKKRVESEEESERAAEYVEEGAEWYAEGEYEEWYAWKWFDQGGDDGIPQKYTPCAYLFKNHYCKRGESCPFSHNIQLFGEEPFASYLKEQCWVCSS